MREIRMREGTDFTIIRLCQAFLILLRMYNVPFCCIKFHMDFGN